MKTSSKKKKKDPIILIALDGAEYSLIQKYCDQGLLPTIERLKSKGCWGLMDSTADLCSGTVWPSVITSLSPINHGVFFGHKELKCGTYQIQKRYANQIKGNHFWKWLSQAGQRIAIFDAPHTYPLEELNGIHIVAWGSFAQDFITSSIPSDLVNYVFERFGTHPLSGWYERRPETVAEYEDFFSKLISGVEKRGLVAEYLLGKERWDFFFMVFSETHWSGHLLWHLADDQHPFFNRDLPEEIRSYLKELYIGIDAVIARIVKKIPNATVIVFSPEGMGSNFTGNHLLREIIERLGYGAISRDDDRSGGLSRLIRQTMDLLPSRRWGSEAIRKFEEFIPLSMIEFARKTVPQEIWDNLTRRVLYLGNNWKSSKAFVIPGEFAGAIRINLKGREPNGMVEPGAEYDDLCNDLTEKLNCLINVETGRKAVKEVLRVDQLFKTDFIGHFPDLVVKWTGDYPVRELFSPDIGSISGDSQEVRSGAHRPDGFLIANGRGIRKGKIVEGADIKDIAPTVFSLMGNPVPEVFGGKILTDIFD